MFTSELFGRPGQWDPHQGFRDMSFLGWASATVTTSIPAIAHRLDLSLPQLILQPEVYREAERTRCVSCKCGPVTLAK